MALKKFIKCFEQTAPRQPSSSTFPVVLPPSLLLSLSHSCWSGNEVQIAVQSVGHAFLFFATPQCPHAFALLGAAAASVSRLLLICHTSKKNLQLL